MSLVLDENESFSMTANVLSSGWQGIVLSGYLKKVVGGETYMAPLLPEMFYGWDGTQLSSWRQYIGASGQQVILSRSGGQPTLPSEEIGWRKVTEAKPTVPAVKPTTMWDQASAWWNSLSTWEKVMWVAAAGTVVTVAGFTIWARRKMR
jgi:hypothetical protein